jgi:acetylglutamate synthase
MVDNFQLFRSKLKFESEDDYYFLAILRRGKDSPLNPADNYPIKFYYIKSLDHFDKLENEIKSICNILNARAYLYLNRRSFEKTAFQTLKHVADNLLSRNYERIKNSYTSVSGSFSNDPDKKWIIDVDNYDEHVVRDLIKFIDYCMPLDRIKYLFEYPTKSGVHLVTRPFDLKYFNEYGGEELLKKLDATIFKDGMSLLYVNLND